VDPGTLGAVAGELGHAYDDLNGAYGEVIACSDAGGAAVFGAPEVVTAWNAFCSAFCDEFREDVAALAELMTTTQRYTENEARVTDSFRALGARWRTPTRRHPSG
jgi:hypothetical protein